MCERLGQNFDGHVASELGVVRLIHFSHAARANLREHFIRTETCAGRDGHFFSPAVQLRTTVIRADAACSGTLLIRKRWPSADTLYRLRPPFAACVSNSCFTAPTSKLPPL